jgi:RNA recognition motif-containing protein
MGKRLYVGNLPYDADEASLREAFAKDGRTVERVHIVLDRETQRPRGFAFVEMATDDQARAAITAMDGQLLGTRQLRVTEAEERRPGPGGPGGPRPGGFSGPRPSGGGEGNRFGPDARPKRDRQPDKKAAPKRRVEDSGDPFGGRRGASRFDDDDE